ncbi:MAG: polysaccharide biosynthesis/export family protein [Pseudomonadota bacterium]|nr:polysaccharide biosynthesis/export family protein [Pseudomonadota bacterium]
MILSFRWKICLNMMIVLLILLSGVSVYAASPIHQDVVAGGQDMPLVDDMKMMDVWDGVLPEHTSFAEEVQRGYRLASDDVLNVKIYNEPELSGQYRVDAVGQILMPLIGAVDVMDKTAKELVDDIELKLKDGYLKRPSVSVEIAAFRPFYLLGEVRSPGYYGYAYGLDVIKAVAMAGGFTYRANQKKIYIKRDFNGMKKTIEAHVDTVIYPGDVITVKERFF